jgi:hypothetical protein
MTVEGNDRFLSTATCAVEVTVQESSSIIFPLYHIRSFLRYFKSVTPKIILNYESFGFNLKFCVKSPKSSSKILF